VATIGDTLRRIFALARERGLTPADAADALADDRLAAARDVRAKAAPLQPS
jgi:hypothetical protein